MQKLLQIRHLRHPDRMVDVPEHNSAPSPILHTYNYFLILFWSDCTLY